MDPAYVDEFDLEYAGMQETAEMYYDKKRSICLFRYVLESEIYWHYDNGDVASPAFACSNMGDPTKYSCIEQHREQLIHANLAIINMREWVGTIQNVTEGTLLAIPPELTDLIQQYYLVMGDEVPQMTCDFIDVMGDDLDLTNFRQSKLFYTGAVYLGHLIDIVPIKNTYKCHARDWQIASVYAHERSKRTFPSRYALNVNKTTTRANKILNEILHRKVAAMK
jgi:hypothetical protein